MGPRELSEFFFLIDFLNVFIFWPHHMACGILVPWLEIEPVPPALKALDLDLDHWTTREIQLSGSLEIQNDQGKSRPHSSAAAHQE